mmetsp:Transcript_51521/g.122521  ORF Transcript_51521/g.122521 Transcript_51521/m.122521 type:complete len:630 (+) Transcript_51521:119-2008(+)|eukprot:CAMPEP_0178405132 /NCGR_PEP_ID=MMETSP0689_2-20121128/18243_1 /TAXON_ID=160604 /ORGANISM="Amphidinium massartii, Strain CS-259" /LENGTH=629 /DNA_ID=CAMNT_0020026141 /DNA_START=100 /DNA_END=1989 /DNA_ORIENTATION=+
MKGGPSQFKEELKGAASFRSPSFEALAGWVDWLHSRSKLSGCLSAVGEHWLQLGQCLEPCLPAKRVYSAILDEEVLHSVRGPQKQKREAREFLHATYSRRVDEILRRFEFRGHRRPITDFYTRGREIGTGNYGAVQKWTSKLGGIEGVKPEEVAVKHIRWDTVWHGYKPNRSQEEELRQELRVLMMLDSPYLVRGHEWFESPRQGIYFVMELCSGGSLQELLDHICNEPDRQARLEYQPRLRRAFLHVTRALAYLHGMTPPLVHCDLKPDNVLFKMKDSHSVCKLVDFGLSSLKDNTETENWQKGTQAFMAPQQFLQQAGSTSTAMDMWSLGVMFTWMTTAVEIGSLQHPMLDDKAGDGFDVTFPDLFYAYRDLRSGASTFRTDLFGDDRSAFDLAGKLLVFNEQDRWSAAQILGHEWMPTDQPDAESTDEVLRESIGTNLRTYANLELLERRMIGIVAARLDSQDLQGQPLAALRQLRRIFSHLDTNRQGWLTQDDLVRGFSDISGGFGKQDVEHLFAVITRGVSRKLYWTDWLAATMGAEVLTSDDIMATAFLSLDTQHKVLRGREPTVDAGDLSSVVGLDLSRPILDALGVEEITFNKFKELMRCTASKRQEVRFAPVAEMVSACG